MDNLKDYNRIMKAELIEFIMTEGLHDKFVVWSVKQRGQDLDVVEEAIDDNRQL